MKRLYTFLILSLFISSLTADPRNPNTDWMSGSWGVGFHYLQDKFPETMNGGSKEWNAAVNAFDVNKFVDGVQRSGAKWVLFTLGQNSGYYCSPNATLDRYSGYKAGERNSTRDLPLDIAKALRAKGIKLILYLPSNAPAADSRIANGLGVTTLSGGNWVINETFLNRWSEVIREWSVRYGDYVDGWWFDGWYSGSGFKDAYGSYYHSAVRAGNPKGVFCVNTGLNANGFKLGTNKADYSALEARDLNYVCNNRWISNASGTIGPMQWATFTLLGGGWWTEGSRDRYTETQIRDYMTPTAKNGGAITWATYVDARGNFSERQIALLKKAAPKNNVNPSPTDGWTERPYTYIFHTPPNVTRAERYQYNATTNEHHLLVYKTDAPRFENTSPRCELRFQQEWTSGKHQFEADIMVSPGTHLSSIVQVFGGVNGHATTFMMWAADENGGVFKRYNSETIETGIYNRWIHVNLIHDKDNNMIYVYMDGVLKFSRATDAGAATHYFKCGVYGVEKDKSEVRFRNIKYWVKTSNTPPTVTITAPVNNAAYNAPASIILTAEAKDNDGSISKVDFYNGNTLLGTDITAPYSYTWTGVNAGSYSITARATDNSAAVTTSPAVTVKVNSVTPPPNVPPTVSISAPANNASYTAPAAITITVNAADSDGTVSKVEFYNGSTLLGTDNTLPYNYNWTNVAAGTYSVTAKATDNNGAVATSAVVTVKVNAVTNTCSGIAQYVENGGYVAGSKVQNGGEIYECKPWPYSGWCNGAAWAYGPGVGSAWQDAWTRVGTCAATRMSVSTESIELVYSDPANGTLVIKTDQARTIEIFNSYGDIVLFPVPVATGDIFDISNFSAGIYIVRIHTDYGTLTQRIMKQ